MTEIPTWHQRAMAHPDHQSGVISEGMIRARMCEEIADLRKELDAAKATIKNLLAIIPTYPRGYTAGYRNPHDAAVKAAHKFLED